MNQSEFNKLGMFENVQVVFTENGGKVVALKSLKTAAEDFAAVVAAIYGTGSAKAPSPG